MSTHLTLQLAYTKHQACAQQETWTKNQQTEENYTKLKLNFNQ